MSFWERASCRGGERSRNQRKGLERRRRGAAGCAERRFSWGRSSTSYINNTGKIGAKNIS